MTKSVEQPFSAPQEHPVEVKELFAMVYDELKRLASHQMIAERKDHTLTPTALLHEAYARLAGNGHPGATMSRIHFFAAAADAMRRVLIEHARKHTRRTQLLQNEAYRRVDSQPLVLNENTDLIELDDVLTRLAALHPQRAELVKLRYFGGLKLPEAAEVLGISLATAHRNWALARAWLSRELIKQDV
jgi:RNA polymerase sigma factor (TIGR02999 family)